MSTNRTPWVALSVLAPVILFFTDLPLAAQLLVALPLCFLPLATLSVSSQGQATEEAGLGRHAEALSKASILLLIAGASALMWGIASDVSMALIVASCLIWSGAMLRLRLAEVRNRAVA